MLTLQRPDATLHLRIDGPAQGRPVIFANSLGTDLRIWDDLLPLLPPDLRLIRFDKRGHGLSDASPAPYRMEILVDDAEAVLEHLGVTDATFIGLSIGGLIGQGLAAKRPDLIKALVLMDTAAKIGSAEGWQARIDAVAKDGLAAMTETIMDRWFTPPFRATRPDYPLYCNMLNRTTVAGYNGCCAAISGADFTASTAALTLPVLVLCGDQDGSTPPELVRATAELCRAAFHLIPGAGHIPCVEQPAATAAHLAAFLERTNA